MYKYSRVREHQVYKTNWTPILNEKLNCKKDNREEALSNDNYSVGVFKKDGLLVGNIPIGYYMKENKENFVSVWGPENVKLDLLLQCNLQLLPKN